MNSQDITTVLAIWGAVLSTFLAAMRSWEIWRNRTRLEVGYNFTSSPSIGNEIIIRNLVASPVLITYWELQWRPKGWFSRKLLKTILPNEFSQDLKLDGHSSTTLSFKDQEYFATDTPTPEPSRIFLRLSVAGKTRPILKRVYG